MITKLKLKNWKSHEKSELEFTPGTNGLVGIVGSGKTSILDAICFGLFGTFPKLQLRKVKLEDVIMKKPSEKESAEVEVFFSLDGNDYSVKRIIDRKKGTSYSEILENGKLLESPGTKNVTAIVESKLKVNYELFNKAIYSEQNSIDYFLTLGKGQRMKKIDELLVIDRFEKVRSNAVKMANRISDKKFDKQNSVGQFNLAKTEKDVTELKESISKLKIEKEKITLDLDQIKTDKLRIETETIELKKIRDTLELLKRNEISLDTTINLILNTIERIKQELNSLDDTIDVSSLSSEILNYSKQIDDTSGYLSDMELKYDVLSENFAKSKTNMEFIKNEKIDKFKLELEKKMVIKGEFESLRDNAGNNVSGQIEEKKHGFQSLLGEAEACRLKMNELREDMEKLSSVDGSCPVCGTELSEERKTILLMEKKNELIVLKDKIKQYNQKEITERQTMEYLENVSKKLEDMFREISDLEGIKIEFDRSSKLLLEYSSSTDSLRIQLDSMRTSIEKSREIIEEARNKKQKLQILFSQSSEYENDKKKLEKLSSEREILQIKISELESSLSFNRLNELDTQLKDMISKKKEMEMIIINSDELMKEKEFRLIENETKLELVKKEEANLETMDNLIKDLKIFNAALKKTQEELRKEFVEAVNFTMNSLWETLYSYQDFIGVRLYVEEGDYILQLQERSLSWVNVEGTASGGERSIACLALRIAFALVLAPQLRWLVLDEPTHNLDTKSVEDLAQTLREGINDIVDQVFIITHEETLESAITGSLYRLERNKGKDEATKIIQVN